MGVIYEQGYLTRSDRTRPRLAARGPTAHFASVLLRRGAWGRAGGGGRGFRSLVFVLSVLTAVLLQILSNFANDYGDAVKGADGPGRVGPRRSVASGELTARAMFRAVLLMVGLNLAAGLALLGVSFGPDLARWGVFLALGLASVAAAVLYTMGKHPYGYRGYGDFFVFVFFGLVAVAGSYALYGAPLTRLPGLPACAAGFSPQRCSISTTSATWRTIPPTARKLWHCAWGRIGREFITWF